MYRQYKRQHTDIEHIALIQTLDTPASLEMGL